jgi:hypothetical protein
MNLRDKAIGGAAVVEFCIRQIERELKDARALAEGEGLALTLDQIVTAQRAVRRAHGALEALRAQLAESVGSPDASRSGGSADDKERDPPVGP